MGKRTAKHGQKGGDGQPKCQSTLQESKEQKLKQLISALGSFVADDQ